ncbi:hypothetical protein [Enterobacter kobei]|uniref:hypothetical protein n=1 Tax=Enterobacter kobei TaxID=208224 RepID=UPI0007B3B7D1|nr:hypothetical protein [Enterobacter kobei]
MKQYTNKLTPEMLAAFDESPFTAEQLAGMNDEARSLIEKQNAYNLAHPVTAAYLIATEGSLTRNGGTVISEYNGQQIEIEDGTRLNVSLVGDEVRYPDGTTAKISTGVSNTSGDSGALVGSLLDNGDEIISSPQNAGRKVVRAGESLPENFLK